MIDIASVGAITPIETDSVGTWPSSRRSFPSREVDPGAASGGATALMRDSTPESTPASSGLLQAGYGWPAMRGLEGKRAIVTGAARGIGRAIAERLTLEGTRVALVDVDADALRGAARALGGDALALHADVRDEDAVRDAVEQAAARWDGLDVVVANAAIQLVGSDDRADRLDRAVWQETLDVNLTGAFLTAKHGARALLADGGGAIVCVGSPAGSYGIARGLQAYAASKAGIVGLVRTMAADYAARGDPRQRGPPRHHRDADEPLVDRGPGHARAGARPRPAGAPRARRGDRRRRGLPRLATTRRMSPARCGRSTAG